MRSRRVTVPDRSGRAFGIVVEARLQTVSKTAAHLRVVPRTGEEIELRSTRCSDGRNDELAFVVAWLRLFSGFGFDSRALPPNIMISLAFVDLALAVSKLSPKTVPWRPAQCVRRKGNERAQNENEPAIRDPRAVGGHDHTSRDRRSWQSGRRWPGAAAPTHVPRDKSLRSTEYRSRERGLLSS